jgi:hypothetical protein
LLSLSSVIRCLPVAGLLLLTGCPSDPDDVVEAVEAVEASAGTTLSFVDVAAEAGLDFFSSGGGEVKNHLLESTGSGVAIGDVDGDGREDVFLTTQQPTDAWLRGERPYANALFRNREDGSFENISDGSGVDLAAWSCGAYFADVDNDGNLDLFVTTHGQNRLYRGRGDGTFEDITSIAGVAGDVTDWSASAAFGDLDGDGNLDLYVTNYAVYDLADPPFDGQPTAWRGLQVFRGPIGLEPQRDRLYRGHGDGTFEDISEASGIYTRPALFGLGVTFADFDEDGDADIYVANDSTDNFLWRNDGDFRFHEIGTLAGVATNEDAKQQAGMGTDTGDFDGDGKLDLIVTNFSHDWNTLYRNLGRGMFEDITFEAGFQSSYLPLAWGVQSFDADLDGHLDLFIANGHIYPQIDTAPQLGIGYHELNLLYRNRGDGHFDDLGLHAGPGMQILESTRGAANFDFDRDGDLDLLLTNLDGSPNLLRNDLPAGPAWIAVRLEGERSPRDGTGARLIVTVGDRSWLREANPYGSYLSSSTHEVFFGLADVERIDRLEIRWPSGSMQHFEDLEVGRRYRIHEERGITMESE